MSTEIFFSSNGIGGIFGKIFEIKAPFYGKLLIVIHCGQPKAEFVGEEMAENFSNFFGISG